MPAHPNLVAQNAQFEKKIHTLAAGVYSAVGYAASNVHFLVGQAGVVVIDTTETTQAAQNILADFRKSRPCPSLRSSSRTPTATISRVRRSSRKATRLR